MGGRPCPRYCRSYWLRRTSLWWWTQYQSSMSSRPVAAGEVSASLGYLELLTCLEMAKQAKELPEASKMGTSGQR